MASQTSYLLSPLDQLMPVTYNRVILAFTTDADVDANTNDDRRTPTAAIDALRQGLQTTCSQLPYLKGRVVEQQQQGGRLAISWSEQDPTPALQEIARPADIPNSYAQLKREGLPSHRLPQSLCPVAGWVAQDFPDGTVGAPVIATSYTCLDGGILVTLCVHHSVMDGTGTGRLISLWGRNCKAKGKGSGEVKVSGPLLLPLPEAQEPQHRLERLKADGTMTPEVASPGGKGSHPTSRIDSDHDQSFESLLALHPEYTTVPPAAPKPPFPPCTSKIYTFPVDKLKSTATASNTSVNNVLCAIIWSCITTVRSLRRQKESIVSSDSAPTPTPAKVKLGMAVNGRPRMGGSFAARDREQPYLGNVNLYCVTALDLDALTTMGGGDPNEAKTETPPSSSPTDALTPILNALSTSIARIDPSFISEVITLSERAPDIKILFPAWDFFNGPDLTITSWANLDTYAVDFGVGLGTPDFVRVPCIEGVDGLNIVLPRRRNGKSVEERVEVVVMLRRDDMADLEASGVWRDWTVG